jgi:hypothetical protein
MSSASTLRSTLPGVVAVKGVWTGAGGVANCTVATGDWSKGIRSIAYNAATGKYKITLTARGQQIVGGHIEVCGAAGATKKIVHIIRSTYSPSAQTVEIEVWTQGTEAVGPALVALATTDKLLVSLELAQSKP